MGTHRAGFVICLVHLVHPAGAVLLEQEVKDKGLLPVLCKEGQQVQGCKKAGLHALCLQLTHKLCKDAVPEISLWKYQGKGHHIDALVVDSHRAVFAHKGGNVRFCGGLLLCAVSFRIPRLSKMFCHGCHDAEVIDDKGVGDGAVVHCHVPDILPRGEPVVEVCHAFGSAPPSAIQ